MSNLSAFCVLVVVSVLVQNANGKRGCAAFGHACYGGHGKRSSLPENLIYGGTGSSSSSAGGSGQLGGIPPLPYAKLALINRSKTFDGTTPELRLVNGDENDDQMLDYAGRQQDKFERAVRYTVNAILRQLLEESQRQPPVDSNNFQPSDVGQQSAQQSLMDNEKK